MTYGSSQKTETKKKTTIGQADSYRLNEMVMRDLGEKVVDDMSSNVMMDIVDQSIVPIESRQSSTKITPFLIEQKTMWYQ